MRFRQSNRLKDELSFGRVFKKPKRSQDKMFIVLYQRNDGDTPRLGMAISKKKCPRATARNRLKRVIRESFRLNQEKINVADVVVLNRPAATNADNKTLFDSLENHWQNCQTVLNGEIEKNG